MRNVVAGATGDIPRGKAGDLVCRLLLLQGLHRWHWLNGGAPTAVSIARWGKVLSRLSPPVRATFLLRHLWGWTEPQIAAWAGVRLRATIHARLVYAADALRADAAQVVALLGG